MNCRQFDSQVDAFLDGELAAAESGALERHAAGCRACAAQLATLRSALHALRMPEFRAAPPGMLADFHRRLTAPPTRRPALVWPWAAGTAFAAACAAAIALTVGPPRPRAGAPGEFQLAKGATASRDAGRGSPAAGPTAG